jgi:galactokinase
MSRVDAPAEVRMVPYTFLRMFGSQPAVVSAAPGGLRLLADPDAELAVAVPWGAVVAGTARDDGVLELRSRNRPAEGVRLGPDEWATDPAPDWARPAIRAAVRLRAAGFGIGGATLVVHTGLPQSLTIPTAAGTAAATVRAFTELYGLSGVTAVAADAAELAALTAHAGEAVLLGSGGTTERLPCDLAAAGLRLLVVEPGDPAAVTARRPAVPVGAVARAAEALRAGDLARFGRLLTAGDRHPAAIAATAAGALGASSHPVLCVLLHATDLTRVRVAVRAALPNGTYRPRFLTATPAAA